jgi:hypothetical protein
MHLFISPTHVISLYGIFGRKVKSRLPRVDLKSTQIAAKNEARSSGLRACRKAALRACCTPGTRLFVVTCVLFVADGMSGGVDVAPVCSPVTTPPTGEPLTQFFHQSPGHCSLSFAAINKMRQNAQVRHSCIVPRSVPQKRIRSRRDIRLSDVSASLGTSKFKREGLAADGLPSVSRGWQHYIVCRGNGYESRQRPSRHDSVVS